MRGKPGRGAVGVMTIVSVLAGCGGEGDTFDDDIGAGISGRGGAAGADSGRADASAGRGGSSGSSDAAPDRGTAGQADARMDAPVDLGQPDVDARIGTDGGVVIDGPSDGAIVDGSTPDGADDADASSDDASDVTSSPDASDGDDSSSTDAGADASSSDVTDSGTTSDTGNASDAADAGDGATFDAADAPSCNDGNPATTDFYSSSYGCGHLFDANPGDSDAWITYDAGFHVDVATGLGWAFPAGSRNASTAATACDGFSVAGLLNWRIATIDESRSLAGGCARTATGGTCPLEDPSCLSQSCGFSSPACDSCFANNGPNAGQYCKVDVAVCTFFHTSSVCNDCSDSGATDWVYIPINGNFYPMSSASSIPTACVSVVPGGVPTADGG